jgi:methylisocitrate lyase
VRDFATLGRTYARAVHGLDHAVERANAYARAGADMVFVEAPQTTEELQKIAKSVDAPTMANVVEGGKTPIHTSPLDGMSGR